MEPVVLIAFTLTLLLGVASLLCTTAGIVLWRIEKTRYLAPLILFVPTLALLGAMGSSWGLGYLAAISEVPGESDRPLWAWISGFPVGGVLGALFGLWFARLAKTDLTGGWRQPLIHAY